MLKKRRQNDEWFEWLKLYRLVKEMGLCDLNVGRKETSLVFKFIVGRDVDYPQDMFEISRVSRARIQHYKLVMKQSSARLGQPFCRREQ